MSRGRQIGRLKLKVPEKGIQQKYLADWKAKALLDQPDQFPRLSSAEIFGNAAPLKVEIGPGTGDYLCDLAEGDSQSNFLGIEASKKAVYLAVDLAASKDLKNIRFIRANFKMLYGLIERESWDRVYLHFPDPVHKRRDEKRRIFDRQFLDKMAEALLEGGEISVVSDEKVFFDDMLKLAKQDERFSRAHEAEWIEFQPRQKSRFQQFWEKKGISPQRFILKKL